VRELWRRSGYNDGVTIDTHPGPVGSLHIEVPATPERLSEIRHQLNAWLAPFDLSDTDTADIVLVVNEACTNCIEHAYRDAAPGLIRVQARRQDNRIVVDVADTGVWQTPPREPSTRGRGLPIMHAVSGAVELDHTAAGTTVRLEFDVDA
jgi:anti-sigma regulatory factor (Ser/Thr protein kinase)